MCSIVFFSLFSVDYHNNSCQYVNLSLLTINPIASMLSDALASVFVVSVFSILRVLSSRNVSLSLFAVSPVAGSCMPVFAVCSPQKYLGEKT